ncbi:hypothetical protein Sme01_59810 [Sphaerisporangium melleum]|uniref:DUF309 domain-containing protein n=1 Tax=Sphaerisporangium melleum TaxID=321316 RepID=A0A917RAJ7_9ACTN|nr:DUF309 domain-containing protein [Sphaerisporangium melleum]GGK98629.1 hypothetical protein GCM10007964_46000 [Sphaerisporangium melleum]GII73505.1 hypothetical protein Sme01_59810 [Sphaerisporangium melleum]
MRRDRDAAGRPRNARPRDALGRPLPKGTPGVERVPDDYAPDAHQAVADAYAFLAEERPFHAHEVLEARWKTGPDGERELWQGLAQICVGLTHLQRGNLRGAGVLLDRGADQVTRYASGTRTGTGTGTHGDASTSTETDASTDTDISTSGHADADSGTSGRHTAAPLDLAAVVQVARDLADHPATEPATAIRRIAAAFGTGAAQRN